MIGHPAGHAKLGPVQVGSRTRVRYRTLKFSEHDHLILGHWRRVVENDEALAVVGRAYRHVLERWLSFWRIAWGAYESGVPGRRKATENATTSILLRGPFSSGGQGYF